MIVVIILCSRRRKKSKALNIDDKPSHIYSIIEHDYTDGDTLPQLRAKANPTSKLETVNALYVSSKVKSLDSLLRRHDKCRPDVIVTPNPSYAVGPSLLRVEKV